VFGKRVKFALWAVLAVLAFAIAYEGVYKAFMAVIAVETSLEAFICGATELVHVTLNGNTEEDPTFPGTIATLRDMEEIRTFLDEGPASVEGLDDVIVDIGALYKDVVAIDAVLGLLGGLHSGLFEEAHSCELCTEMEDAVHYAKSQLEGNDGYKLAKTVKDNWPPEADTKKILDGISKVTAPLQSLQEQMMGVGEGLSGNVETLVETWLPAAKVGAFVLTVLTTGFALILVCCGCTSAYLFTFRETVPPPEAKVTEAQKEDEKTTLIEASDTKTENKQEADADEFNPYNPRVHFWASRTWCWGFCYCVVTLLVGAFTSAVLVPVTETCELLVALKKDANAVDNFGSAVSENETEQMKRFVQGCIIDHDSESPKYLMDILGTPGADDTYVTHRTTLKEDVEEAMEKLFGNGSGGAQRRQRQQRPPLPGMQKRH